MFAPMSSGLPPSVETLWNLRRFVTYDQMRKRNERLDAATAIGQERYSLVGARPRWVLDYAS
jgi:hypothetical protein